MTDTIVWLITGGDYYYCRIIGVSSTEEKANEAIAKIKDVVPDVNAKADPIKLDDLDSYLDMLAKGYKQYDVEAFRAGRIEIKEKHGYDFRCNAYYSKTDKSFRAMIWARTVERALEITTKKRNELIEKGEW